MSGRQRNIVINNENGLPTYFHDASEPVINRISRRDLGGLLRETVITDAAIARGRGGMLPAVADYLTRSMGTPLVDQPDPRLVRQAQEHKEAMERGQLRLNERRVRLEEDGMRLQERRFETERLGKGIRFANLFPNEESHVSEGIPRNQGRGEQGNSSSGQLSQADEKQYERYFGYK